MTRTLAGVWVCFVTAASAQGPRNVLLVVNLNSPASTAIGAYYAQKRSIPRSNVCEIRTPADEIIARPTYDREIAAAVAQCLKSRKLEDQILYIVTTLGVPLGIDGAGGAASDQASVDSELTLLYSDMRGKPHETKGPLDNPFFKARDAPFTHTSYPIYLVTRLAAYEVADVKAMIDRSLRAANRGKVVLDLMNADDRTGNDWLRTAAILLPGDRVVLDESEHVVTEQKDVIGFASWGSNDPKRTQRIVGIQWLPGAVMTEYVSTNARTFEQPPADWRISTFALADRPKWFKGSPQTLVGDYIREGVTGIAGHVFEPYLGNTPRPEVLFPAYLSGRNFAESFYMAIPSLSWKNVVIGDPLCRLAN